jgi:hypothetical protein
VQPEECHLEAGAQGGQHYIGQADRIIGLLKLCLEKTMDRKQCSNEEVKTLLYKAAQTVNSHRERQAAEDPTRGPITPLHLQLGRATVEIPEAKFDLQPSLTKILKYMEEIKKEFWDKWMAQVFQGQVLARKWRKTHWDIQVGDLVLMKNENAAGVEYQGRKSLDCLPGRGPACEVCRY